MPNGGLQQLHDTLDEAEALVAAAPAEVADLAAHLKHLYSRLFLVDFADYDVDEVREAGPALQRRFLVIQLGLRDRIAAWAAAGLMSRPIQTALRDVFRVCRYGRELLGEIELRHPRLGRGEATAIAFSGPAGLLEVAPRFAGAPMRLMPGDVVLQRGMANNSAAIARIGDIDSQFSHVAIVAENGDGLVMVEALIEDGAVVTPIDAALAHGIGRAVIFRHRDPALAREAATLVRDHVLRTRASRRSRVLYDFTMQPEGYRHLFCAKLVRLAYSMASTGEMRLPTFATLLDMRNRDFIERIGVATIATFAPGDLELEPDFDIVAEWRDYRVTSELRLKDMIMTKLFEWMESHDYRFRSSPRVRLVALGGRLMSHLPEGIQEMLRPHIGKVPPNMSARAIGAVAMLHWTAEELYARIAALEDDMIRKTGRQLHPRQALDELELIRLELGRRVGYLVQRKP